MSELKVYTPDEAASRAAAYAAVEAVLEVERSDKRMKAARLRIAGAMDRGETSVTWVPYDRGTFWWPTEHELEMLCRELHAAGWGAGWSVRRVVCTYRIRWWRCNSRPWWKCWHWRRSR